MLKPTEKFVLLSGTIYGSLYIFQKSLHDINELCLKRDTFFYKDSSIINHNCLNVPLFLNTCALFFSGMTFSYLTCYLIQYDNK
jgi:hypothetical protein